MVAVFTEGSHKVVSAQTDGVRCPHINSVADGDSHEARLVFMMALCA